MTPKRAKRRFFWGQFLVWSYRVFLSAWMVFCTVLIFATGNWWNLVYILMGGVFLWLTRVWVENNHVQYVLDKAEVENERAKQLAFQQRMARVGPGTNLRAVPAFTSAVNKKGMTMTVPANAIGWVVPDPATDVKGPGKADKDMTPSERLEWERWVEHERREGRYF